MAVTEITQSIKDITGISSVSSHSIEDGQRFVVSSIPKNLLNFAQTASSASTDGSAISFSINDSIIDVQRNGYSCTEIPLSESIWALDSSSLQFATAKSPVWYHKQGSVHFAPVTDGSNAGYVFYVDYSKIDDSCDLRNAVIFYAASHEFSKLASSKIVDFSSISVPVAPLLSDNSVSFSQTAPQFVKPVEPALVAFNDYWTLSDFGDSDPGSLSLSISIPVPPSSPSFTVPDVSTVSVTSTSVSNIGTPPTYTPPNIPTGDSVANSTSTDITAWDNTAWSALDYDFDDENINVNKWFQALGDMIQNQEDFELANAQMQKITGYINAYQSAMQNRLNKFNEENAAYQVKLQEAVEQARVDAQKNQQQAQINSTEAQQEAQLKLQKENQEYAAILQKYSAEVSEYQATVTREIQQHTQNFQRYQQELSTVFQAWSKTESDKIQNYQTAIQNEQASFNKENAEYQAQLQISIQNAQLSSQDDAQKLQNYSSELQSYQAEVNKEIQKITVGSTNAAFYSSEAKKYYEWARLEVTSYIQNNSKMIQQTIAAQQQAAQQQG